MTQEQLAALSDQELLQKAKKSKTAKIYDAGILGVLIGIAIYSSVKNGLGVLSILPFIYMAIAARNKINYTALEKLLKERNLK